MKTIHPQKTLHGPEFFFLSKNSPPGKLVVTRESRISLLNMILENTKELKSFLITLDIFDRLFSRFTYEKIGLEKLVKLSLYILDLASSESIRKAPDISLFWKAMCTLNFEIATPETCTWTAARPFSAEKTERILGNYLVWPDGKTSRHDFLQWEKRDTWENWKLLQ